MEKAGNILNALFERLHVHDEHGYVKLFSTWRTVCDEVSSRGLADHSSIVDVRNGALIVAVDHSGWMQIIQMYEQRLLEKLQRRFPDMGLSAIHFQLSDRRVDFLSRDERDSPDGTQPQPAERSAKPEQESSGQSGAGQSDHTARDDDSREKLEEIENERLRQSLERLREDLEERDLE